MTLKRIAIIIFVLFAFAAAGIAYETLNYSEQGGKRWVIGGSIDVVSGGDLDLESGSTFKRAGNAITLPPAASAILYSLLTTNAVDAANSIWGISNALVFEGATADANEMSISPADPLADITLTLPRWTGDVPVVISQDATQYSASNQTTDGTSISVAANVQAAGTALRFTCGGTITGANANKSVILYIDNSAILTLTTSDITDVGDWVATFIMAEYTDLAHQKVIGTLTLAGEVAYQVDYATDTTDFSGVKTVKTQIVSGNAGDTITQEYCLVEFLP